MKCTNEAIKMNMAMRVDICLWYQEVRINWKMSPQSTGQKGIVMLSHHDEGII